MTDPRYTDLIKGLNAAQRSAVLHGAEQEHDASTGPLIVLAGPGTGKTRVIIHRIARIIADGADPESIVAVTFTNKAATQLRERLAGIVGHTTAARVRAQTFHALGLSLVRRFASDLGLPPIRHDAAILDSAQRIRLIREAITTQNLFPARRAAGVDALADIVHTAMRALANRAIEPEICLAFLNTWQQRIAAGQDSAGAPVDDAALRAEAAKLEEFADIARAYAWFAQACRSRGWLGFEDLIMLPIRLLREAPRAAAIVHAEMRHALVDEFQDVNAGQIEFLRGLFPQSSSAGSGDGASGPDLCIVGDDDQAIYGFRGADDRALARFDHLWPGARRILLTENYRSQSSIIAASNRVISLADHRFAPDKQVIRAASLAANPPEPGSGVECIELGNDNESGATIATAIMTDRASGGVAVQPLNSYAVVCRSNTDITRIVADLELEGIPARGSYGDALSEEEGVQDVLAWISLLVNPRESWPVRRILTRPPLAADPLAAMEYERRYRADRRLLDDETTAPSYLSWLIETAASDEAIGAAVTRLASLHRSLSEAVQHSAAPEALEQIIIQTDAAHADLLPAAHRARRVTALLALVRLARLSLSKLDQPRDLREFWRYWNDLDADDQSLRQIGGLDERTAADEESDETTEIGPAVAVISAHKAKGLEWDTVFVPRVTPMHGYGKSGKSDPSPVPAGLLDEDAAAAAARQPAEERRVFYVACTRAERRLVLLSKKNKNPSSSTHFFEEFTRTPEGQQLVTIRDVADLRSEAAAILGRDDAAVADSSRYGELGGDALDRARISVRLSAAEALEFADRADAGPEEVDAAAQRLRSAAARLAIVSYIAEHREPPDWIKGDPSLSNYAAALTRIAARDHAPTTDAPRPPLRLSFTAIDAYTRCPCCYWLRYIKNLPETQRKQTVLGTVVHTALERFYTAVREAESVGTESPTLETLLRLGRDEFISTWPRGSELDGAQLDQALAQLTVAHEKLHDPSSQVLEIERSVEWEYIVPAAIDSPESRHRFSAKLDRIDQASREDGRVKFRLIDYKTGQSWKKLKEPPSDDLQFGVYALALPHILPDIDPADVDAEYWILSTGERGVIALADLDLKKVEKTIHKAVRGILAGEFEPASKCSGDCRLLRAPLGGG